MRTDQTDHGEWVVINSLTLGRELDLSPRQVLYNLNRHFEVRSQGSGSFLEIRVGDLRVFRRAGKLVAAGFPTKRAIELSRIMDETGENFVDVPGGVRVAILEDWRGN